MEKEYEIYGVEAEMFQCNEYFPNCIGFELNLDADIGFGQLNFINNTATKKLSYDTECMGKEFFKDVLDKWLEGIVHE